MGLTEPREQAEVLERHSTGRKVLLQRPHPRPLFQNSPRRSRVPPAPSERGRPGLSVQGSPASAMARDRPARWPLPARVKPEVPIGTQPLSSLLLRTHPSTLGVQNSCLQTSCWQEAVSRPVLPKCMIFTQKRREGSTIVLRLEPRQAESGPVKHCPEAPRSLETMCEMQVSGGCI